MSLKLLVGLGNPEARYASTRHNAGFCLVDKLATKCGGTLQESSKMKAELGKLKFAGFDVMAAKPLTYMNLSGQAVQAISSFYKIDAADWIVAHDEVALPLGKIRLARGGGSAGNHGIESIFECTGIKDFARLRIGVGPDPGGAVRAQFVLSPIDEKDWELYVKVLDLTLEAYEEVLCNGIQAAMNKYNGIDLRPYGNEEKPES